MVGLQLVFILVIPIFPFSNPIVEGSTWFYEELVAAKEQRGKNEYDQTVGMKEPRPNYLEEGIQMLQDYNIYCTRRTSKSFIQSFHQLTTFKHCMYSVSYVMIPILCIFFSDYRSVKLDKSSCLFCFIN